MLKGMQRHMTSLRMALGLETEATNRFCRLLSHMACELALPLQQIKN